MTFKKYTYLIFVLTIFRDDVKFYKG